jgi:ElaB/YqjD/DUF883 family membrane-anchored ribosome-binding protein
MRTNGEHKTNGSKSPEQILAEIDRTRGEMDRTLSAIEQRLTPGQLVDQGLDYLRHSGANEFVQNLGGTAKQNPLPVAVTAIGLAWLMALGRQPAQQDYGSSTSASGLREGMSSAKDRLSGSMTSAKESPSGSMDSMRGRAGDVADTARQQWERARGGIDYLVNEQPFALGAIGLAIGAILGAAAPTTRAEQRVMGDTARNVTDKAKEMTQKAKDVGTEQLAKATGSTPASKGDGSAERFPTAPGSPDVKGGW